MLVSTVVTHNGGTASHTRLRLQAAASSAATPHTTLAARCCSRCRLLPYSGGTLRLVTRDRRRHQQHARNTTLPPRSDGMHAYVQRKPRNGTHRHARLNPTNDRWPSAVHGESEVQHREPNINILSHRCVHITADSHARTTRTRYVSAHGVLTLHHTTAALRNTQAFTSLRADVTRSAQNSW
jgi:hypothetical protein